MAISTPADHRKGLRFAAALRVFAKENAPDVFAETKVHALVHRLEIYYGYSHEMKKAVVLRYLDDDRNGGSASIAELVEHFHWKRDNVKAAVDDLVEDGRVERYQGGVRELGGRPPTRYRLKKR